MQVVMDMETRSRVDLGKCGVYRYAEDPSTEVLCIAVKVDDSAPMLWVNQDLPISLRHLVYPCISDATLQSVTYVADPIIAHNAQFERVMWENVMTRRYGFDPIPDHRWKCTAAKAAAMALPRSLDGACTALGLQHQKDKEGRRIMLKMCKPRTPTKNNPNEWFEDPDEFKTLCAYCVKDVEAEYELDQTLPDLNEDEAELYQLDQRINSRGVHVDVEGINKLIEKVSQKEQSSLVDISKITDGYITSTRQRDATLSWLRTKGVQLPDLTKQTVEEALKGDLPRKAKRLLQIRQSLSKSSVSKLDAMKRMANKDNRVRGTMLFHAASTGRWGGKGMQPHNYPRDSFDESTVDSILDWNNDLIEMVYGDVFFAASRSLRGMITAAPVTEFLCADFSSIEARVLAWLAFERKVLNDFEKGLDAYKVAASDVFRVPYTDVSKDQRFIGKTIVLACGYGGWVNAFRAMANDEINQMPDETISRNIKAWRDSRPLTTKLWYETFKAAIAAIKDGKTHTYGLISCGMRDGFLHLRLPSGRLLAYYSPRVEMLPTPYGVEKETITYMGVNSLTKQWERQKTFPGKVIENVVQGIARDVLAEAMIRCEDRGYPVAFHVHDEIVSEVFTNRGSLSEFSGIVSEVPAWATGLPLKAEGWAGRRYRK